MAVFVLGGLFIRRFDYQITPLQEGMLVQDYLKNTHGFSRRIITRLKREPEHIRLNGEHIRMVDLLHAGDVLTVILVEQTHIIPNGKLFAPVVYEDEDIIVFNKPAHMPVHPSVAHLKDTLANYFTDYMQKKGFNLQFRPINRLDADTTGLCLVAKNALSAAILAHQVQKEYTAILCGELSQKNGEICAPIARHPDILIKRIVHPSGQQSITQYQVEACRNGYTLVKVRLLTGRTHQIRVHFSYLGYPLVGDEMYGGSMQDIDRQALCCNQLLFTHPTTKKTIHLCINMQEDMRKLLL